MLNSLSLWFWRVLQVFFLPASVAGPFTEDESEFGRFLVGKGGFLA